MQLDEMAVRARTAVACARVGWLTTYARHPSSQYTTCVKVRPRPDGTVEVQLGRNALGARQLLARPVATLEISPVGCEPVLLHGAARRLPGLTDNGALLFHLDVAVARVGARAVPLDERSYFAAAPDPLAHEAPAVLSHLNAAHADALAACLRAAGHQVGFARATALDSGGLTIAAVTAGGVESVRLRFPHPVTQLRQLPPSLSAALSPRCGCSASRAAGEQGPDQ
jgi:hypothetical protein